MPHTERSFGRLAAGVVLAPLAGALASLLVTYVFAFIAGNDLERTVAGAWAPAQFVGFWAFFVCLAYTLVVGGAAFAFNAIRRRPLTPRFAITTGLLLGAVPFTLMIFLRRGQPLRVELLMIPAIALAASIVTAWAFWRIALARTRTRTQSHA